ncbi:MAG: hypothetical protein ACPGXZ_00855 [Saprospiraceae bacterium]
MIPKVGKTYNCFDDGKVTHSRKYTIDVVEIVPFAEADEETLKEWKERVKQCYWLFSPRTDFFILTENGEAGDAVFARTKKNTWFSLGNWFNSGLLDVDGSLTTKLNNRH